MASRRSVRRTRPLHGETARIGTKRERNTQHKSLVNTVLLRLRGRTAAAAAAAAAAASAVEAATAVGAAGSASAATTSPAAR